MKLDIKIDGLVGIFTTNKLVVEHTGEGIEIIELADQDTKVVDSPKVEMPVETLKVNELKPRDVHQPVRSIVDAECSTQEYLNRLRKDEMVLAARKYCGENVSDIQFSNILSAIKIYCENALYYSRNDIDKYARLQRLTCFSVFITAGATYQDVKKWYQSNYPDTTQPTVKAYSALIHGTLRGEKIMCKLLWPEYYRNGGNPGGRHPTPIDKCQKIVDAILAGYSNNSIARYCGVSRIVVHRIRKKTHPYSDKLNYNGVDTNITMNIRVTPDVRICKHCGKIIPVRGLLATPNADYCTECQKIKE